MDTMRGVLELARIASGVTRTRGAAATRAAEKLERMRGTFDEFDLESIAFEQHRARTQADVLEAAALMNKDGEQRREAAHLRRFSNLLQHLASPVGDDERRY